MRKFDFIILSILQLFFASEAWACIRILSFQEKSVLYTLYLLFIWLFYWAIHYTIRGLLAYKSKNIDKQNPKTKYFLPTLFYLAFVIFIATNPSAKTGGVIYGGYILYIIYCCGYQTWAYTKQKSPKKWAWICPIIPFYYMITHHITRSLLQILKTDNTIVSLCLSVQIYIVIICGIYKFINKQETSVLKIIWALLCGIACVYGTYILYGYYPHIENNQSTLMC